MTKSTDTHTSAPRGIPVILLRAKNSTIAKASPDSDYAQTFHAAGFIPYFVPVLTTTDGRVNASLPSPSEAISPPSVTSPSFQRTPTPLASLLQTREQDFHSILVTSARGIAALRDAFADMTHDVNPAFPNAEHENRILLWRAKPIWVVGKATGSAARELGFANVHGESAGDAETLSDMIIAHHAQRKSGDVDHPASFLFLAGDKARDVLPTRLKDAGFPLEKMIVYGTRQSNAFPQDLAACLQMIFEEGYHHGEKQNVEPYVVFFSPSGVDIALPVLCESKHYRKFRFATIGPTTTGRLVEMGEVVKAEALKPCAENLLAAISEHASTCPSKSKAAM
ncbi:tetrapyrrole biosynthesis, uroporphyrinogen III synthase [Powellomyces hirtus]|nr:tetrapyrrole biosynthesis, uroporphyrinogen III synthase [Powellomyces hirtus]